jgi:NAD(P)-dependent dehydrogenase (short-subunit alcohol dehydrogenase family)
MRTIKTFKNKTILITGASSGIGKAAAIQLAKKGATVILVARREELLKEVVGEIHLAGGTAYWYAGDLSKIEEIDTLTDTILAEHPSIDVLVNNAGRSIRRPMEDSLERYHDFQRCMDINYFAPVRLIRNLLPALLQSKDGHIINSTTWGTLLPAAGFGPYNASKIALDTMANTLRMEMEDQGISVTQIHFPLVHTAMSGATKSFRKLPGMTPDQAAGWIVTAVKKKPRAIMDTKTRIASGLYFCFPSVVEKASRLLPFSI